MSFGLLVKYICVSVCTDTPVSLGGTGLLAYSFSFFEVMKNKDTLMISMPNTLFCFPSISIKATEAQQPGAAARGNSGGAGKSLHCHGVHGKGLFNSCMNFSVFV